jgi:hypothetical protein
MWVMRAPGLRTLRMTLVVLLAAACARAPEPTAAPLPTSRPDASQVEATTEATPSVMGASPRPSASTLSTGLPWIRVDLGEDVALAATPGPSGWVAVGQACPQDPSCPDWGAAAWTSPDGMTWTKATVLGGTGVALTEVTWNGAAFFALGSRYATDDGMEGPTDVVVWSSLDGTEWWETGSFRVPGCEDEGCPVARGLVGNTAALLVPAVETNLDFSGPYRSADGATWTQIKPFPNGTDRTYSVGAAVAAEDGIFLAGVACRGCPLVVLRSRQGLNWTRVGTVEEGVGASLAYDGRRLLVARRACLECGTTTVWSAAAGQAFEQVAEVSVGGGQVRFTGTEFVLAGLSSGPGPAPGVFVSPDGSSWEELGTDVKMACGFRLVVGPAGWLLIGPADCPAIWFSRGA